MAQRVEVAHGDRAATGGDQPLLAQAAQRPDDGLARGAGPAGDVLLGDREVDDDAVVAGHAEALRQLDEARRDTTDAVEPEVLGALAVGVAQPRAEDAGEREARRRRVLDE